jgi:cob(I)alamin adenosyltransferase
MTPALEKGLVHVYTGNGKGKTTASFGLAVRAIGHGIRVCIVQFMKGRKYGELKAAKRLGIEIEQYGRDKFVNRNKPAEVDVKLAKKGWERAKEAISGGEYGLVILDEINVAMYFKLLDVSEVVKFIKSKPPHVELVLTGRYAPDEITAIADYVTEMKEVKHPYQKGITSRKGVEW